MAHTSIIKDTDAFFEVNPLTREIKNNSSTKIIAIQFDHNAERLTFSIPRYIEQHDMLESTAEVHYINIDTRTSEQNAGVYEILDLQSDPEDEEKVIGTWLISQNATRLVGSLYFLLRFSCYAEDADPEYSWHTAIYKGISVIEGMNNGDSIIELEADILEQWREDLFSAKEEAEEVLEAIATAETKCATAIKDKVNDANEVYRLWARDAVPNTTLKNYKIHGKGMGVVVADTESENNGKYKIDVVVRSRNIFDKNSHASLQAYFSKTLTTLTAHSNANVKTVCIPCKPSTLYSLSKQNLLENGGAIWIGCCATVDAPKVGDAVTFLSGMDNSVKSLSFTTSADATYVVVYLANMGSADIVATLVDTLQIEEWDFTEYCDYFKQTYSVYTSKPLEEGSYIDFAKQKAFYADGTTEDVTAPTLDIVDTENNFFETAGGFLEVEYYIKERNYHTDKTIVCFGDSITGNYLPPSDYPSTLAKITGANVINVGFGGTSMSLHVREAYNRFSMYQLADAITSTGINFADFASDLSTITSLYKYEHFNNLANVDFNKVDYVLIAFGANDIVSVGADIENAENTLDTSTYIGAARYTAEKLLTAYPHLKLVFMTPIYRYFNESSKDSDNWYSGTNKYAAWGDALIELGKELKVPVIDMYNSLGINKYTRGYYFPETDGAHPNSNGTKLMAEKVASCLI